MAKKPISPITQKISAKKPITSKATSSKEKIETEGVKPPQKKKPVIQKAPVAKSARKKKQPSVSKETSEKKQTPIVKAPSEALPPVIESKTDQAPATTPASVIQKTSVAQPVQKKKQLSVSEGTSEKKQTSTVKAPSEALPPVIESKTDQAPATTPASVIQKTPVAQQPVQKKKQPSVISKETSEKKQTPIVKAPSEELPPVIEPKTDQTLETTMASNQPQSVHVQEPLPVAQFERPEEPDQAPDHPSLFIVHITPEIAPIAKVGGLADVVFGLTHELAIRGNHVEIVLPKYDNMRYDQIMDLQPVYNDLQVPWYEGEIHCTVYFGFVYNRKCFFIEPHSSDNFFNRGSIYGFKDDVLRYAFFSRAAMEFLWKSGKHPDIIHCHDWQTALVPVYLYEFYQRMGMTHPRICLTIHNFQHQGVTGKELLRATGLHQPERFFDYHRMRDNNHTDALNLLKTGIVYSNFITTVSPRYAHETKDQGQGFGLEPTLHTHHIKYGGVVNGIDYEVWNPEVDEYIPTRYGIETIEDKYNNKWALRQRFMLADNEKPIVAFIGRLDPQKGLDLVRHAIFYCLERGAQFVLLGSSPDQSINADFWGLKGMLNDSPDCHLEIGFNEELAHLIYAGADMMLVPSRFEPCGLTQLISLRYATIPIARSVGGLADTIFDKDHSNRPLHERNGYLFDNYDQIGLESALGRALACYSNYPEDFRELMKNAMRCDYSWNVPGRDYLNIYDYIREK